MTRSLRFLALALATSTALASAPAAAQTRVTKTPATAPVAALASYQIDPVHSELSFRIRHLVGRVSGTFTDWSGTVVVDPTSLSGGSVNVTVQTASIHTLNPQRDAHLRTPDFFAADSFPTMTFRSSRVVVSGHNVQVHGELTLRGRTRPVVLNGRYAGRVAKDPWGKERIAFQAGTTINRHDFGVSFNQAVEGMSVIGDEVQIEIAIEAVRQ